VRVQNIMQKIAFSFIECDVNEDVLVFGLFTQQAILLTVRCCVLNCVYWVAGSPHLNKMITARLISLSEYSSCGLFSVL